MTEHLLKDLETYGFCDPASGKTNIKRIRARQAIVVIVVDSLFRIFVALAWAGRIPTSSFRDKILDEQEKWRTRRFGIEANAMQELFGDLVAEKSRERSGTSKFLPVHQPTKIEKDFRIRTSLEPVINDGRLFIHESMTELQSELFGFPTAQTKDLVDALASVLTLIPRRPRKQQISDEAHQLADYLRKTGAPSHYIERRIADMSTFTN